MDIDSRPGQRVCCVDDGNSGVKGTLFTIYGDYQVAKAADGFAAVGCGDAYALGAMYASAGSGIKPRKRIKLALTAAERFSGGVRSPFVCLSLKR